MDKHFKTKSEIIKSLMENTKREIEKAEKQGNTKDVKFLNEHLKELEEKYTKYLENDEPYYEVGAYEFYLNVFNRVGHGVKRTRYFTNAVESIVEDKINSSIKIEKLQNLVKAFKNTKK